MLVNILRHMLNAGTMDNLDGWVFIYNSHDKVWMGTTGDNYFLLKNDFKNEKVLKTSTFQSLQSLIIKGKGDLEVCLKLLK